MAGSRNPGPEDPPTHNRVKYEQFLTMKVFLDIRNKIKGNGYNGYKY